MGQEDEHDSPYHRFERIGRERDKIVLDIRSITLYATHQTGVEVLHAPASHHGIEAEDNHGSKHSHVTYKGPPGLTPCQIAVRTCCIGGRMTPDDKFAQHTRQSEQQDTHQIDKDKGGTAVLTRHIGETPHIAQADSTARRGQNDTQLTSETSSVLHHLSSIILLRVG